MALTPGAASLAGRADVVVGGSKAAVLEWHQVSVADDRRDEAGGDRPTVVGRWCRIDPVGAGDRVVHSAAEFGEWCDDVDVGGCGGGDSQDQESCQECSEHDAMHE